MGKFTPLGFVYMDCKCMYVYLPMAVNHPSLLIVSQVIGKTEDI